MENASLPENERAAKVQTYTLTSVITAMVCAASIAVTTVVVVLIGHATNRLSAIMQGSSSLLEIRTDV